MGRAKKLVKDAAKESLKKARKRKAPKYPLYTDAEKKEMRRLSSLKSKYKKLAYEAYESFEIDNLTMSMQSIRNDMDDEEAQDAYYHGYFDDENYEDYKNKDFRTWMLENGDGDLLADILDTYERVNAIDLSGEVDDMYAEQAIRARKYLDKYNEANAEMQEIRQNAKDRQVMRKARDIARKNRLKTGESLIDTLDRVDMTMLTKPEKAVINEAKGILARSVISGLGLDDESDLDKTVLSKTISATIMQNPKEGIRTAIKETIVGDIAQQYGNNGAELAGSLIDLALGKGSVKGIGMTLFDIGIKKSGWNSDLLKERAEELVDSGKSTNDKENIKQLGRDVALDIAKDVILSGGQIYAAIPMILKDALFDVGKAGIRKIKQDK